MESLPFFLSSSSSALITAHKHNRRTTDAQQTLTQQTSTHWYPSLMIPVTNTARIIVVLCSLFHHLAPVSVSLCSESCLQRVFLWFCWRLALEYGMESHNSYRCRAVAVVPFSAGQMSAILHGSSVRTCFTDTVGAGSSWTHLMVTLHYHENLQLAVFPTYTDLRHLTAASLPLLVSICSRRVLIKLSISFLPK